MLAYAPASANKLSYEEAVLYCQFCNHKGYTDWRLPTFTECYNYRLFDRVDSLWYDEAYKIINEPFIKNQEYRPIQYAVPVRDI